jgi:DNA-binding response OmpR family regulator
MVAQQTAASPDAEQVHVMVVDDEPDILAEISDFLSRERMGVTTARSAEQAIGMFSALPSGIVTVVLTDLTMPGGGGLSLANAIRDSTPSKVAPAVIVMTGRRSDVPEDVARDHGVFEVIAKPLNLSALGALIRKAHAAALERRGALGGSQAG